MPSEDLQRQLDCGHCTWSEVLDRRGIEDRLRAHGMLRRNARPSDAELTELLDAIAPRLVCPACERVGLIAGSCDETDVDWGDAPVCESCGKPIPRERLEALPHATLCATCQQNAEDDRPSPTADEDFCPRCGAPMVMRAAGGTGTARYALRCSAWPRCRGELRGKTRGN